MQTSRAFFFKCNYCERLENLYYSYPLATYAFILPNRLLLYFMPMTGPEGNLRIGTFIGTRIFRFEKPERESEPSK